MECGACTVWLVGVGISTWFCLALLIAAGRVVWALSAGVVACLMEGSNGLCVVEEVLLCVVTL